MKEVKEQQTDQNDFIEQVCPDSNPNCKICRRKYWRLLGQMKDGN